MELWDIYDKNRKPKGYTHVRGNEMKSGDFHIIVNVWIRNSKGQYLITKRTPNKMFGGYWECTGGSVVAGDSSRKTAVKEVQEEAGLKLLEENGILLYTYNRLESHGDPDFCDVWFFEKDFDINDVVCQPGETCDAMWASQEQIREMIKTKIFVPRIDYIEKVFQYNRKK